MKTTPQDIAERIKAAYSQEAMRMIHDEQVFAYGGDPELSTGFDASASGGGFIIFPDIASSIKKVGRNKRTLKAAIVARSRLMSSDVEPEFEGLSKPEAEIRRAYWRTRYRGNHDRYGSGKAQIADAWLAGWQHGAGAIQLQLKTNPLTDLQKLVFEHIPPTQLIVDPHATDPRTARWIAAVKIVPAEDAIAAYGQDAGAHIIETRHLNSHESLKVCLVTEYFDLGFGGGDPTYAIIIGDIGNMPFRVERNPFDYMLPFAFMVNTLLPGMKCPVGQVSLQRNSEEALNRILDFLNEIWKRGPGRQFVDTSMVSPENVEKMRNGDPAQLVEFNSKQDTNRKPFYQEPAAQPPTLTLEILKVYEQEFGQQAGLSEIDRGQSPGSQRTAYEIQQQQAAVSQNRSGAADATLTYIRDVMERSFKIAAKFDRDPFFATVFGETTKWNDEEEPNSQMHLVLEREANLVISYDSLTSNDSEYQRLRKVQILERVLPMVGKPGGVKPEVYTKDLLETLGIANPDEWLIKLQETNGEAMGELGGEAGSAMNEILGSMQIPDSQGAVNLGTGTIGEQQ